MQAVYFKWYDYISFVGMVAVSVGISVYCGFWKKQSNKEEYLLGGKTMGVFPVTTSLIASVISGITLVAYPADIYKYGSNTFWLCLTLPLTALIHAYIFLPVYFKLDVTNLYQYLEIRFNRACRFFASLLFLIVLLCYNPVVIYIPSLAFEQATGYQVVYIAPIISAICVFYTTIGGLKAVIWTDTFQFFGMVFSSIAIVVIGFITVGGVKTVFETSLAGERLDIFDFRFDLTLRDNFWAMICGGAVQWSSYVISNQGVFQKCRAVPTLQQSRLSLILYGLGVGMFMFLTILTGNIMYTKYSKCDPLTTNQVHRDDQLLPYFVLDVSNNFPGLPGIFIAGLFSAALSSYSAALNTCASIIYEDFLAPLLSSDMKQKREGFVLKLIVITVGIVSTVLVFVIQQLHEILPFIIAAQGSASGPVLGLCILGVLIPIANAKGALTGAVVAFVFVSWICFGNVWYNSNQAAVEFLKPLSVENCDSVYNNTVTALNIQEDVLVLYRISFWYMIAIGTAITIVIGTIISLLTKKNNKPFDKNLCSPILHRFLD